MTGDLNHLNHTIHLFKSMINLIPTNEIAWVAAATNFYELLQTKADVTGAEDDSKCAMDFMDKAIVDSQDHTEQDQISFFFAVKLKDLYHQTSNIRHLNRAIDLFQDAVQATRQDSPHLYSRMIPLGSCLANRYRITDLENDLDDAIEYLTRGLDRSPVNITGYADYMSQLGLCLLDKHESTRNEGDLERAITLLTNLLEMADMDWSRRNACLAVLAQSIYRRFKHSGDGINLDQAIEMLSQVVDKEPTQNWYKSMLGDWLQHRSTRTGSMEDLNRAVNLAEMAFESDQSSSRYRIGLGELLRNRSEATGSDEDLDRAISLVIEIVESGDDKDSEKFSKGQFINSHGSLATMLHDRHMRTGSLDDISHAIRLAKTATEIQPDNGNYFHMLGGFLSERWKSTQQREDIDAAIQAVETAIDLEPRIRDYASKSLWQNTLANLYLRRHTSTKSPADLDRGLQLSKEIVESMSPESPNKGFYWHSYGSKLLFRARHQNGTLEDVNYAFECLDNGLACFPSGHPMRARILLTIVESSADKYARTQSEEDIERSLPYLKECWSCQAAPLHVRMRAVNRAAELSDNEEACELLHEAIELLPRLCPRSLPNNDKQHLLENAVSIASNAAYYHLKAGKGATAALKCLESGRSVISNILMEMRIDISDLKEKHPILAAQFESLTATLDPVTDATDLNGVDVDIQPMHWESRAKQRQDADTKFTELVESIRHEPGFEKFLLPMTEEDLIATAGPDSIIVINADALEPGAFLINSQGVRYLALPNLTRTEVQQRVGELRASIESKRFDMRPMLEWLWKSVCCPCLEELGFHHPVTDGNWPRVWWVPTGGLCQLPLHAAGIHEDGSADSVLDRVMSSYAVSINALRHSRKTPIRRRQKDGSVSDEALLVSMRNTPGQMSLPYAEREVDALYDICPSLNLNPVKSSCTKGDILHHLNQCRIFHFAGHGYSHPRDPSKSYLLLDDWQSNPLTVADLRESKLQDNPPFLGYLSACSTGSNQKTKLLDEGIHLVGAFQLAGFRHVVGTLWAVSDQYSADVAQILYQTLQREGMTDRAVCRGLHEAVRNLRKRQIEEQQQSRDGKWVTKTKVMPIWRDQFWIPYIHFGV